MLHLALTAIFILHAEVQLIVGDGSRGRCPGDPAPGGFLCSSDCSQLGYCDETSNWVALAPCPAGQVCIGSACVQGTTCTTTTPGLPVMCSASGLGMPNLNDTSCRSYYTCSTNSGTGTGNGVLQNCPTGTVFDACSGACTSTVCQIPPSCTNSFQILPANPRLVYLCHVGYFLWATCPNGIFVQLVTGPECIPSTVQSCENGDGTTSTARCTAPGRFPIATDCGYLQCYSDLSFSIFTCRAGYHYDDSAKNCVLGACTGPAPVL